jgi:hypothetical protein
MEAERARIEQLEALVSRLRHDLRGAISPAALIGDRLRQNADPSIQRAGGIIAAGVQKVLTVLDSSYELVPSRGSQTASKLLGAGRRRE